MEHKIGMSTRMLAWLTWCGMHTGKRCGRVTKVRYSTAQYIIVKYLTVRYSTNNGTDLLRGLG